MASAGTIKAGKAAIELFLDSDQLRRQLRGVQRQFRAVGQSITQVGTRIAGLGAGLAAPFAVAITAAGNFQETLSKFETIFGIQSAAARKFAEEFGETVGRSQAQLLDFLAGFQSQNVQLGLDEKQNRLFSQQLTELAVDLASFYNISDEAAFGRLISGLNGSSEVLEIFAVNTKQAALEAQLLNQGIKFTEATEAQKRLGRLAIIFRETAVAQGDATRTADSFTNQMKALKADASDAAVTIGTVLIPAATQAVQTFRNVIGPVAEFLTANKSIVPAVAASAIGITALGSALVVAGVSVSAISALVGSFATVVGAIGAPAIAAVVAIGALGVAMVDWQIAGERASAFVSDTLLPTLQDIGAFVRAGDLGSAGELFILSLQLGMERGIEKLRESVISLILTIPDEIAKALGQKKISGQITSFINENVRDTTTERRIAGLRSAAEKVRGEQSRQSQLDRQQITKDAEDRRAEAVRRNEKLNELLRNAPGKTRAPAVEIEQASQNASDAFIAAVSRSTELSLADQLKDEAKSILAQVTEEFETFPIAFRSASDIVSQLDDLNSKLKDRAGELAIVSKAALTPQSVSASQIEGAFGGFNPKVDEDQLRELREIRKGIKRINIEANKYR